MMMVVGKLFGVLFFGCVGIGCLVLSMNGEHIIKSYASVPTDADAYFVWSLWKAGSMFGGLGAVIALIACLAVITMPSDMFQKD